MGKKKKPYDDEASISPMRLKFFGDPETSRMPKNSKNRKRLAAAVVMTAERQRSLRSADVTVERRTPTLAGTFGTGIIIADNDPSDHGLVLDGDFSGDRIIVADPDGPVGGFDFDPSDPFRP